MARDNKRDAIPVFFQQPDAKRGKSFKLKFQEFLIMALVLASAVLYLWLLGK